MAAQENAPANDPAPVMSKCQMSFGKWGDHDNAVCVSCSIYTLDIAEAHSRQASCPHNV